MTSSAADTWRIEELSVDTLNDARIFALQARADMFGDRFAPGSIPADLANMQAVYGEGTGCLLIARSGTEIVGCIAYRAYDHRFPALDFSGRRVVEVVRLYVRPDHRRQGLAGLLFGDLKRHAVAQGIEVLYLHTHPFLPGAEVFWKQHGFNEDARETDPVWQTIHMSQTLRP